MTNRSVFLITLGFVPNKLFKHTAARLVESLSGKHDIQKIFVAKPYPLNLEANLELNRRTARKYGYTIIEREVDSGAAQDFNLTIKDLGLLDEDLVILYDHDCYPIQDAWDDAFIAVMDAERSIDWACLWHEVTADEFAERGGSAATFGGVNVMIAKTSMMAMTSIMRGSFLNYCGGLIQPHGYYGGVESAMTPKLKERGTKKAFLCDYKEDQRLKVHQDEDYFRWKVYHVTNKWAGSFKEFVDAGCPDLGPTRR